MTLEEKYIVYVDGEPVSGVNPNLVDSLKISDEPLEEIKLLHMMRHKNVSLMRLLDPVAENDQLKWCSRLWHEMESDLQRLWGFPIDSSFHRNWWALPHCTCPKMDNADDFPYQRYYNGDCPIHGF